MEKLFSKLDELYLLFFSERRRSQFERLIFFVAIIAFVLHFLLVVLAANGWIRHDLVGTSASLNPLKAIYTPFTIILLYEIYLLIYYLPKSITIYLGKQYEIVTLILIRKIFNDLAKLAENNELFNPDNIIELLLTFGGLLILLMLIFCFYKLDGNKDIRSHFGNKSKKRIIFISIKKILALLLLVLFAFLFIRSFFELRQLSITVGDAVYMLKTINDTFFNIFFIALILTEVLLLLFTFNLSDKFSKVIRNSGFIISTILLKLSFSVEGLANIGVILVAVFFGVAILGIYKLFEQKLQ